MKKCRKQEKNKNRRKQFSQLLVETLPNKLSLLLKKRINNCPTKENNLIEILVYLFSKS